MKLQLIGGMIVFAFVAEGAFAACSTPATQVIDSGLTSLLNNNTVCAIRGTDRWQEEHHSNTELWDYKKGDGDPVDPRKQVGNWTVIGTGVTSKVSYDYGSGGQYDYEVWDNGGGSYSLCGADVVDFTLVTGINVRCGF